jgi:hypothetical protein
MFLLFFNVFSSTKSKNRTSQQVLPRRSGGLALAEGRGSREKGEKMHTMKIMYKYVCKCKMILVEAVPLMGGEG